MLAAIMFTDIVGFTALMSESEASALRVLKRSRQLVQRLTRRFKGRWLETVGDGNLIRFSSATDAVNCALTIQKSLCRDADIRLRIGIHVGDVIEARGHIYGDGVNVASRIQGLAEPGGVVVSETVYDAVRNKAGIRVDKMGVRRLEGLDHPIQVYTLSGEAVSSPLLGRIDLPDRRRWVPALILVALALAAILSTGIYANYGDVRAREPTIAVLPFADMSPSGDQEYFSDGLAEEILNLLAQTKGMKVIGRTSSFQFKGRNIDMREIGEMLGAAHVLEGSVRKSGNRLRITVQLVETNSGFHLWSKTFDRDLQDIFTIQTEIGEAVTAALRVSLVGPDDTASIVQGTDSIPAYERFLQARRLIQGRTLTGLEAARKLLDEAFRLDPDFAPLYAADAQAVLLLAATASTIGNIPLDEAVAQAQPLIDRALALDPRLAEAHAVQGLLFNLQRETSRGNEALVRALEINPSLSDALTWRAVNFGTAGRLREWLEAHYQLVEIDPLHLAGRANLSLSLMLSGETAEAVAVARRIRSDFPNSPIGLVREAEALHPSGRLADARVAAEGALALEPENYFVQASVGQVYYRLGDHQKVLALPWAPEHGLAMLALGRFDEASAAARERLTAVPDDYLAAYFLLYTLSLAGRHGEVLSVYRERWGDLAGLEAAYGFDIWTSELVPIAAAQQALTQRDELARTLEHWGVHLAFLRQQGYAYSGFRFIEASHLALTGDNDAALAALTQSVDLGWREPLLGIHPAFAALRDEPAFQAQVARMTDLINGEREKLGMEPLL